MKMKFATFFLQLMFLLVIIFPLYNSKDWDAKSLADLPDKDLIIDTNNYLDRRSLSYTKTLNYIREIMDKKKFQVYVYFINSISSDYKSQGFLSNNVNIEKFVNDLAFYVEKGRPDKDKNSLFIVFSIDDRKDRIRTGENVKQILTNQRADIYLENLKSKLRSKLYTEALEDLLYNLNWRLTKNTFWYDFFEGFFSYLIVFGVCFGCCYAMKSDTYKPYEKDYLAENKLEKIKRISENNKDNVKFVEDNCIICLEEFKEEEKNKLLGKKNEKENKDNIHNDHINLNVKEKNEIKESNLNVDYIEEEEKGNLLKNEKNLTPIYGNFLFFILITLFLRNY